MKNIKKCLSANKHTDQSIWVARGTGTPKDRDDVNKRDV